MANKINNYFTGDAKDNFIDDLMIATVEGNFSFAEAYLRGTKVNVILMELGVVYNQNGGLTLIPNYFQARRAADLARETIEQMEQTPESESLKWRYAGLDRRLKDAFRTRAL